jgi:hypothetical protein
MNALRAQLRPTAATPQQSAKSAATVSCLRRPAGRVCIIACILLLGLGMLQVIRYPACRAVAVFSEGCSAAVAPAGSYACLLVLTTTALSPAAHGQPPPKVPRMNEV